MTDRPFTIDTLPPTTIRAPYTVEANVGDAVAVINQVAGKREWIRTTTMTAELIPHARVEIPPGAGHFLWHEHPARTPVG